MILNVSNGNKKKKKGIKNIKKNNRKENKILHMGKTGKILSYLSMSNRTTRVKFLNKIIQKEKMVSIKNLMQFLRRLIVRLE